MPRLRLTLPTLPFHSLIRVQIQDINYGNHLSNGALLNLLHELRVRWLSAGGFSEMDLGGCGMILADVAIQFRAEAFYADELEGSLGVSELDQHGCVLQYRLRRCQDQQEIALAQSSILAFDYQSRDKAPLPPAFAAYCRQFKTD